MTPAQKQLVRSSFDRLNAQSNRVTTQFYGRLFELDPTLKPMFSEDLREQYDKLMVSFKVIIDHLDNLDELTSALHNMGARHVGYGVRLEDYETARVALIHAIRQTLGNEFDRESEEAWNTAYTLVVNAMNDPDHP